MTDTIAVVQHFQYKGYINVTDLVKALIKGGQSYSISFDRESLDLVAGISGDRFKDDECEEVIIDVVYKWIMFLTKLGVDHQVIESEEGISFVDFEKSLSYYYQKDFQDYIDENCVELIGDIDGFIGDDSVYLCL